MSIAIAKSMTTFTQIKDEVVRKAKYSKTEGEALQSGDTQNHP